jgi:hypothetical protein
VLASSNAATAAPHRTLDRIVETPERAKRFSPEYRASEAAPDETAQFGAEDGAGVTVFGSPAEEGAGVTVFGSPAFAANRNRNTGTSFRFGTSF